MVCVAQAISCRVAAVSCGKAPASLLRVCEHNKTRDDERVSRQPQRPPSACSGDRDRDRDQREPRDENGSGDDDNAKAKLHPPQHRFRR